MPLITPRRIIPAPMGGNVGITSTLPTRTTVGQPRYGGQVPLPPGPVSPFVGGTDRMRTGLPTAGAAVGGVLPPTAAPAPGAEAARRMAERARMAPPATATPALGARRRAMAGLRRRRGII